MAVSFYTTTDIAAAKYRYETLKADRALVFSDTRQSQHMQQAWLITRKAGYVPDSFSLEHKTFGMMLGKDGETIQNSYWRHRKINRFIR